MVSTAISRDLVVETAVFKAVVGAACKVFKALVLGSSIRACSGVMDSKVPSRVRCFLVERRIGEGPGQTFQEQVVIRGKLLATWVFRTWECRIILVIMGSKVGTTSLITSREISITTRPRMEVSME